MRQKQIIDIKVVDTFKQSMHLIEETSHSNEYELIGFEVKRQAVKDPATKQIVGYEWVVKLVKSYEEFNF